MKSIFTIMFIFQGFYCAASDSLFIDLDKDKILDSVIFCKSDSVILCKLSTQNFTSIKSQKIEYLSDIAGLTKKMDLSSL